MLPGSFLVPGCQDADAEPATRISEYDRSVDTTLLHLPLIITVQVEM